MKRYRTVIFDWDGTLLDSTQAIASSMQEACRDLGLPVPSDVQARWVIGLPLDSILRQAVPDLAAGQLSQFKERYRVHFHQHDAQLQLFDGISNLLLTLRQQHVRVGIATGKSRVGLDHVLDTRQWRHYFDVTRCGDESFGKPHPGMLLDIMKVLDVAPQQLLMVGDTSHDVMMAHNAGVDSLAVSYGAHDKSVLVQAGPTFMVDTVDAMEQWLLDRVRG